MYYGKVEFEIGGNEPANANAPGNIVAFRADGVYHNHPGKAGRLYLISKDGDLDDIGGFDTNRSDDSLKATLLLNYETPAKPESQSSRTPESSPANQSQAKPVVYKKGDVLTGGIQGAEMVDYFSGNVMDMAGLDPSSMYYSGQVAVVLPDGTKADANCPLKMLKKLRGFGQVKGLQGGLQGATLTATFQPNEQMSSPQQVSLLYDGLKWQVTGIK